MQTFNYQIPIVLSEQCAQFFIDQLQAKDINDLAYKLSRLLEAEFAQTEISQWQKQIERHQEHLQDQEVQEFYGSRIPRGRQLSPNPHDPTTYATYALPPSGW